MTFILIFKFVFVFHPQAVHAKGSGEFLQQKAHRVVNKNLCSGGISGIGSEFACKSLDLATADPEFLKEMINMILIISMSLTIVSGKCKVTPSGKELKPKSYTAAITHWIQKIASLIYIYAEIQNIITLRKLDKEYSDRAALTDGQVAKFQALLDIQEAKLAAAQKKLKILKISTLGLGAASAVELGLSSVYGVWGAVKKASEITKCTAAITSVGSCTVPGTAVVNQGAKTATEATDIANTCTANFTTAKLTETMVKTAKNQVMRTVVKGITTAVGGAIGAKLTDAAGGGKAARIGGAVAGGMVASRVAGKVAEKLAETFTQVGDSDAKGLGELVQDTKVCIEGKIQSYIESTVKEKAAALVLDSCIGTTAGVGCGAAGSALCAITIPLQKEQCRCALRNTDGLSKLVKNIKTNLEMGKITVEDDKLSEELASHPNRDFSLQIEGENDSDRACGIDYSSWMVRYDLECEPVFDFLKKDEVAQEGDNDQNPLEGKEKDPPCEGDTCDDEVLGKTNKKLEESSDELTQDMNDEEQSAAEVDVTDVDDGTVVDNEAAAAGALAIERKGMSQEEIDAMVKREQDLCASGQTDCGTIERENIKTGDDLNPNPVAPVVDSEQPADCTTRTRTVDTGDEICIETIDCKDIIVNTTCSPKSGQYNPAVQKLSEQLKFLSQFSQESLMDIHIGLKTENADKWVKMFFNDLSLASEYDSYDPLNKQKVNEALQFLSEALILLGEGIAPAAQAQDADEFVSKTNEASVLGALGATAVAMLVFPKMLKKGLEMAINLQRTPLRRGLFYMLMYFMAKENVKTTKNKISGIEDNIEKLKAFLNAEGIDYETSTSYFNWWQRLEQSLFIAPAYASAKNLIDENLVPLCIENGGFSTACTCREKNNCGHAITNFKPRSYLFNIKSLGEMAGTQMSFSHKMARGRVTAKDYDWLEEQLQRTSRNINPEIASDNLDIALQDGDFPPAKIFQRAKNLFASLQNSTLKEMLKKSKSNVDISKIRFNQDTKKVEFQPAAKKAKQDKEIKKIEKFKTQMANQAPKSAKKEESLQNFDLDLNDINKNRDLDLFKIISNRYMQKVFEGGLTK